MGTRAIVIGSGFGGMSAACYLAKAGYEVTVLEKNATPGGRAMVMENGGFVFDLGPSWYMMPDVFEEFFADFGKKPGDYYELVKLDPSYKVFTPGGEHIVRGEPAVYELFDQLEPGSSKRLEKFLRQTGNEYHTVRSRILPKPMTSWRDVMQPAAIRFLTNPRLVGSYHNRISKVVKHPDLQKILEFMVVFMGGSPRNIPAMYSLLAYTDLVLGIWYPMGGMGKLADAMYRLAKELGVKFIFNQAVEEVVTHSGGVKALRTKEMVLPAEVVVANADYHHVESELIRSSRYRTHNQAYWQSRTLSPSGLLAYLGVKGRVNNLEHHNLFLESDWDHHFKEVFDDHVWSKEPMFYCSVPSKTDASVAPAGHENIFILAPMTNGDQPDDALLQATLDGIIHRIEVRTGEDISSRIVVRDVRAHNYFKDTFNAYKGNAFGLAHTLRQSAIFRPKIRSDKLGGLYYVGQYTNPGTGVPIVTLSGKVVSEQVLKDQR